MNIITNIINNIISDPLFYALSTMTIVTALWVILEENIIRAGFALVVCFFIIALNYFVLNAPFVATSQILIYAVGITLVIVFALMLTSQKQDLPSLAIDKSKILSSFAISILTFSLLAFSLTGNKWSAPNAYIPCPRNTEIIGLKLLGTYTLPFELISVLLLIALIGAVVIAKKDKLEK